MPLHLLRSTITSWRRLPIANLYVCFVFEAATREYAAEGVPVGDLTFQDNAPLLRTLEHPRDGVFALLNSECVRRDGRDANLLKQLLKKHERAPFVGARRGPLPGVFVPRVSVKSTSAERAGGRVIKGH